MRPSPVETVALHLEERKDELAAVVALMRVKGLPGHRLASVMEQVGSAVRLVQWSGTGHPLIADNRVPTVIPRITAKQLGVAMWEVGGWLERGLDVRTVLDPTYPRNLHDVFDRPPLVFVAGQWVEERDARSVAVVGSRRASDEGLRRAARLSRELVEAGFTVVSGLAQGIDSAAHIGALKAGGRTVAVMGTGLDHRYPTRNADLADHILKDGGALVTQFLPHQGPRPWTFPMRNVVMSGLALATAVVEAGRTSGARMQARMALYHGRAVFLLHSLVERHDWAREYVEEGAYGTRAIPVNSTAEIVQRLEGNGIAKVQLAV
jgi:DNA processing protein